MSDRDERRNDLSCPDPDVLAMYTLGNIANDAYEQLSVHIELCLGCQKRLAELGSTSDNFVEGLRRPLGNDKFEAEDQCASSVSHAEHLIESLGRNKYRLDRLPASPEETPAALSSNSTNVPSSGSVDASSHLDRASSECEQLGRYQLLEELGAGGMGKVYKALHTKLDRVVAVKVLNTTRLGDHDAVARFEREMKVIGRLQHPHIVHATDADQADGVHYLVMELVDGIDLSQLSRRMGPLPVAEACELIRQAACGLQYVHEHRLVHRDIKPSNLMFAVRSPEAGVESGAQEGIRTGSALDSGSSAPIVKILDLGLALFSREGGGEELTSAGQVMGTIDYMAPEQFEDTHGVDIRADIYSLGATLYKLLTGHAPFSSGKYGSSLAKIVAVARDEAPSVSTRRADLPARLVAIIDRMCSRDPAKRFQAPADVAVAIGKFARDADLAGLWQRAESADGAGPRVQPAVALSRSVAVTKGPPRTRALVSGMVILLLAIGSYAVWIASQFRDQPGSDVAAPTTVASPSGSAPDADQPPFALEAKVPMVRLANGWQIGKPVSLGPPINTVSNDSLPTLSADGLTVVFGSDRTGSPSALWTSIRASVAQPWSDPIKLAQKAFGSADLSADGLTLVFSTSQPGGLGKGDLWTSTRPSRDEPFGSSMHLGTAVNSSEDEAGPCLSDDGLILLFASERPGGYGGADIWMSARSSTDAPWSEAVNVGPTVNSVESEGDPDLSADGLAMVLASGREVSHGVGDLWISSRPAVDKPWNEPVNLGPEVNTATWDAGPEFAINDTVLYYSTRGLRDAGGDRKDADIWMIPIERPEPGARQPDRLDPEAFGLTVHDEGWVLTWVVHLPDRIRAAGFHPVSGQLYFGDESEQEFRFHRVDPDGAHQVVFEAAGTSFAWQNRGRGAGGGAGRGG